MKKNRNIKLIELKRLICHEKTDQRRLNELVNDLRKKRVLRKPVVVDRKTMMILDGHHRCRAFVNLGIKRIPCSLVDYFDPKIRVNFRRPDIKNRLMKEIILKYVLEGKLFPYKTTKHILPKRDTINRKLVI